MLITWILARPLLDLKNDYDQSSSTNHAPSEQNSGLQSQQESVGSLLPTKIIDSETNNSLKILLVKVKNTFSSSLKQRNSESCLTHGTKESIVFKKDRHKNVSFSVNDILHENDTETCNQSLIDDEKEVVDDISKVIHRILRANTDEIATNEINPLNTLSTIDNNDDDFQRQFYRSLKTRRVSINYSSKDLVYQDLSAEIVTYVLKHALRISEEEDKNLLLAENRRMINNNE